MVYGTFVVAEALKVSGVLAVVALITGCGGTAHTRGRRAAGRPGRIAVRTRTWTGAGTAERCRVEAAGHVAGVE